MHAYVHRGHALTHELCVADIAPDELDQAGLERVGEIFELSRAEVVEDDDLVPSSRQFIYQVGADEPGTTRDQIFQPAS